MRSRVAGLTPAVGFQCSSASRKFLNSPDCRSRRQSRRVSVLFSEPKIPHAAAPRRRSRPPGFSALQRAENSSVRAPVHRYAPVLGFSALQRAENSSPESGRTRDNPDASVSVLFSEPKIPRAYAACPRDHNGKVSVLFSEPKIPQLPVTLMVVGFAFQFQCSSASRKFLNRPSHLRPSIFPTATITLRRS